MPSSRFSGRKYKGAFPPYCHKAPLPGLVIPPAALPNRLQGFVYWTDDDPLNPVNVSQPIKLKRIGDPNTFHGTAGRWVQWVDLTITQLQHAGTQWKVDLLLMRFAGEQDDEHWYSVWVDPKKPFKLGPLVRVWVPTYDVRELTVML